jgi:hypothetical protein
MTARPIVIEMSVPPGPATGRNVEPGMTKAPHPTMQPKAIAHASREERYLSGGFASLCLFIVVHWGCCKKAREVNAFMAGPAYPIYTLFVNLQFNTADFYDTVP